MTTINNHLTLIERVGGIEKAKAIVEGAPDLATHFGGEDGDCDYYRDGEYFDTDYELWMEIYFEIPQLHKINDLRTAIAQHDKKWVEKRFSIKKWHPIPEHHMCTDRQSDQEFKAGDLVVLQSLDLLCVTDLIELVEFDGEHWKTNNRIGRCNPKGIRHATPAEIKAGRRLDHSENVTDHVTDIRNHISPNTKVVEL